jgi:hypothetical protein
MLDVAKARSELRKKSLLEIERATAITWGSRAAACYDLAGETKEEATRSARLQEAMNYRQEAIEHAAMTEDLKFLKDILAAIRVHQKKAKA